MTMGTNAERPRKRIYTSGVESLTTVELLSLLVQGTCKKSSIDFARDLYMESMFSLTELSKLIKMRTTNCALIEAAFELGRRKAEEEDVVRSQAHIINSSKTIFAQFNNALSDLDHEELWALYCAKNGKILTRRCISEGGTDFAGADIKKIMRYALQVQASGIALAHNHPHSSIRPSREDRDMTQKINDACATFDIRLLDHIIVSDGAYFSFRDAGEI